jgi:hypothetical protein
MKIVLTILIVLGALALLVTWLAGDGTRDGWNALPRQAEARAAGPSEVTGAPASEADEPDAPARRELERELLTQRERLETRVDSFLRNQQEEAEKRAFGLVAPAAAPTEERDAFVPAPMSRLEGPELVGYHADETVAFQGTQSRNEKGDWERDGEWTAWHENGALHEQGAYRMGAEHGEWRWWYPNGEEMSRGRFDEGRRTGPWTYWYENGGLMMQGSYDEDKGVGHWVYWHENGKKRVEGEFVGGSMEGHWNVWFQDGTPDTERSGIYEHGVRVR